MITKAGVSIFTHSLSRHWSSRHGRLSGTLWDKFTLACMLVLDSLGLITHTMPVLALGQTPNHMGSYRNPITIVNDYTS